MENHHFNRPFSIAMSNFQRGSNIWDLMFDFERSLGFVGDCLNLENVTGRFFSAKVVTAISKSFKGKHNHSEVIYPAA